MAAFHVLRALICILFGVFVQTNNLLQYYQSGYKGIIMHEHTSMCLHNYPARALRALWLLLADGVPTVH